MDTRPETDIDRIARKLWGDPIPGRKAFDPRDVEGLNWNRKAELGDWYFGGAAFDRWYAERVGK